MHKIPLRAAALLLLAGCSWVTLDPAAEDVLVLPQARLTPECQPLGTVKVSVADNVGALQRHDEEVIADLETLARNNAAQRDGDTVVALGPVMDGKREYGVYRCVNAAGERPRQARDNDDGVEVLPYDGGRDGN